MRRDNLNKVKNFWTGKRVVITGGAGFLGKHLVSKIKSKKPKSIFIPEFPKYDLRKYEDCLKVAKKGNIIIHLAANIGGIGYNREFPGSLFDDNILMGTHMMMAARISKVKKYVALGTICAYPKITPVPFKEDDLWMGYPEETNAPYGLAKKMQLVQAQAYRQQYGFNAIFLLPVNLYGPGDNFNPKSSHVIAALIRKMVQAKRNHKNEVVIWGTGKASREFLYVEDAAEAIMLATEKYNKADPVNLGAGFEIKIKDLALLIKKLTGFEGKIVWDKTKPDGQPRRMLNVSRANREFGFKAKMQFEKGLENTIDWYLGNTSKLSK
ncbi:MAG TPA: GDP-L-fucose synthase [Patescibacteria group bacterium]|nr:GDP-L-fucose synthase [Patescibacteria group bacterium]